MSQICGRSTGEVATQAQLQALTTDQRTCSDCHGYEGATVDGATYNCANCGSDQFIISERVLRDIMGAIEHSQGERIFYASGETGNEDSEGIPDYTARCRSCAREITVSGIEW